MKNGILFLAVVLFVSCGRGQNKKNEYKGIDKESFNKLYAAAKNKTPNYKIIYGLEIGVSEPAFDLMLAEKVQNGEIKAVNMNTYPPQIKFDILNNESVTMGISCSASGVFKNFPVISFKTEEITDTNQLAVTRNKLIDWAISKYGDQYYVSPMSDYSSKTTKRNFRWVADTYSIDITDVMNRVSLSYRTLE